MIPSGCTVSLQYFKVDLKYQIWDLWFPIRWNVSCNFLALTKLFLQLTHLLPSPSGIRNIDVFLRSPFYNYRVDFICYYGLLSAGEREELIVLNLMIRLDLSVIVLCFLFPKLYMPMVFHILSFPSKFYHEMVLF